MTARESWAASILTVSALLWLGLLLGVSFLATPVKFLAPSLTLPVALDVGRHTFGVYSYVEMAAAAVVLAAAASSGLGRSTVLAAVVLAGLVLLQALWLLPLLDQRVDTILQGGMPPPAMYHALYIVLEVVKATFLIVLAALSFPVRHFSGSRSREGAEPR